MERIATVLQRIQERYYAKENKTSIDIDLMLDYTRVLYADLLEWKKNVPQVAMPEPNKKEEHIVNETPEKEATDAPANDQDEIPIEEAQISAEGEGREPAAIEDESGKDEEEVQPNVDSHGGGQNIDAFGMPNVEEEDKVEFDEAVNVEEGEVKMEEKDDYVILDRSVLSFEPPSMEEEIDPPFENQSEEEQEIEEPAQNPQSSAPQAKVPSNPEIPFFDASFTPLNLPVVSDIRKKIGLNDKYLFLNELFDNQRMEYDAVLNQINDFQDLESAKRYVDHEVAGKFKWEQDDETVKTFYQVLEKHFASK